MGGNSGFSRGVGTSTDAWVTKSPRAVGTIFESTVLDRIGSHFAGWGAWGAVFDVSWTSYKARLRTHLVDDKLDVQVDDVEVTKLDIVEELWEVELAVLFCLSVWKSKKVRLKTCLVDDELDVEDGDVEITNVEIVEELWEVEANVLMAWLDELGLTEREEVVALEYETEPTLLEYEEELIGRLLVIWELLEELRLLIVELVLWNEDELWLSDEVEDWLIILELVVLDDDEDWLLTLEVLLCDGVLWLLTVEVVLCKEEDTVGDKTPLLELEAVVVEEESSGTELWEAETVEELEKLAEATTDDKVWEVIVEVVRLEAVIESELETEVVELTTAEAVPIPYWYMFNRLPAPQNVVWSPGQRTLHWELSVDALPALIVLPQ